MIGERGEVQRERPEHEPRRRSGRSGLPAEELVDAPPVECFHNPADQAVGPGPARRFREAVHHHRVHSGERELARHQQAVRTGTDDHDIVLPDPSQGRTERRPATCGTLRNSDVGLVPR